MLKVAAMVVLTGRSYCGRQKATERYPIAPSKHMVRRVQEADELCMCFLVRPR